MTYLPVQLDHLAAGRRAAGCGADAHSMLQTSFLRDISTVRRPDAGRGARGQSSARAPGPMSALEDISDSRQKCHKPTLAFSFEGGKRNLR
jgi:hypothetical protein